jgi:hypothetical protein
MNELDEKTGPIDDKGTAGPGVGQGRTIAQSGSTQQKGIGKESQLSKIAAAVNPGSMAEANPTATQSMISTFMKTFESSAIEMREDTNDDQKELIKTMIDEITKLQTKNMKEFEKAIGKIVGISKDLQNSDNPILQKLGKDMEEKSREEVVKASGYTLTGEKDTFLNRLGRSVGMNTEEEPIEKNRQGIGKLAKGFGSSIGGTLKRGFNIAVGREAPEGSFADNVFTSDEQKRERLMNRIDSEANEKQSTSANDSFKKAIQEFFKEEKEKVQSKEPKEKQKFQPIDKLTDLTEDQIKSLEEQGIAPASEKDISYRKDGKPVSKDEINKTLAASSEQQEDTAGISKDATIEALQKTADSNVLIQENSNIIQEKTTETVDVLKEILELMKKMSSESQSGGGGGDDGGGMDIDLPDRKRSRGRMRARARMASRGIRGRVGGLARGLAGGARTLGSAVLSGGARTLGMLGLGAAGTAGAAGLGTAGAAGVGTAGAAGVGTAGAAGVGTAGAAGAAGVGTAGTAGTAAAATKSTGFLGKIASGASSLGSKAGSILSKASPGLVKGLGFAGRVAGKLALPLAAGMAAYDGYKGFNADPNATTGQKFKNAGRNVLSGLTFGMVDSTEDKMAAGEYAGTQKKPKVGSVEPGAKKDTGSFFSKNKGAIAGAALGPVGMLAGAAYDKLSPSKSKTETGKNMDGALIEQGTAATKDKMQINVPPPTVINQGGGGGQAPPQITFPGGVGNVRSNDPTWLRFQERRAVA